MKPLVIGVSIAISLLSMRYADAANPPAGYSCMDLRSKVPTAPSFLSLWPNHEVSQTATFSSFANNAEYDLAGDFQLRGQRWKFDAGITDIVHDLDGQRQSSQRPVLIITGLMQEARIAAGPGMTVICSSSDPAQLRALLASVDSSTFRGVISFGIAGGLDPALTAGDVVVATEVIARATRWLASASLNEELITNLSFRRRRVIRGGLAGVERVIASLSCKAALRSETGAAAVDMESHIAAAYAVEAALPFAALRVISDPAHRTLPALAHSAIKPNGNIDLRRVLRGVVRNPLRLRSLVSTGIDFNRALRSLRGCKGVLPGAIR